MNDDGRREANGNEKTEAARLKPISLAPLTTQQALAAILRQPPTREVEAEKI